MSTHEELSLYCGYVSRGINKLTLVESGKTNTRCMVDHVAKADVDYKSNIRLTCGQGSVVGIATGYSLDGTRIESR
jgi:hypothetical protein